MTVSSKLYQSISLIECFLAENYLIFQQLTLLYDNIIASVFIFV